MRQDSGTYNGTAGNILTVKDLSATIGLGGYLTGTGLPTGATRPIIKD
jgi:hypothetical protein